MKTFAEVLEEAKELDLEAKENLLEILDKIIADERREEIYNNYQSSIKKNTLRQYSNDVNDLRKRMGL